MNYPSNGDRVIITADLLVDMFKEHPPEIFLIAMAFFYGKSDDECLKAMDGLIESFREIEADDTKNPWIDLRRAYTKMSVFERTRIRQDLPYAIKRHLGQ